MASTAPLPTHSYYTRSKSVWNSISYFFLWIILFILVLFQILKWTKEERKMKRFCCPPLQSLSLSLIHSFLCQIVCFLSFLFQWELLFSSIRFVFLFFFL
jgi:hypothetical protein